MGIRFFSGWIKKNFNENFTILNQTQIKNIFIDLNGTIHWACKKDFEYKTISKLVLGKINTLIKLFVNKHSKNTIFLCMDGVAPLSKQAQQRQRRFIINNRNHISPGTKLMYKLSMDIEKFIIDLKNIYPNSKIIFSDDRVPGEGEHKIIEMIKSLNKHQNFHVYSGDSDMIILLLSLFNNFDFKKLFIIKDDAHNNQQLLLNISKLHKSLIKKMNPGPKYFDTQNLINDFICMSFLFGNDFIPNIPSMEISENGLDNIIEIYIKTKKYITFIENQRIKFDPKSLIKIFTEMQKYQSDVFLSKHFNLEQQQKDSIIFSCVINNLLNTEEYLFDNLVYSANFDIKKYRLKYNNQFVGEVFNAATNYLCGIQWLLDYYILGNTDWEWSYNYQKAPLLIDLINGCKKYKYKKYKKTFPPSPFKHLLYILPQKSCNLLPHPLSQKTDQLNFELVNNFYNENIKKVNKIDLIRNKQNCVKFF